MTGPVSLSACLIGCKSAGKSEPLDGPRVPMRAIPTTKQVFDQGKMDILSISLWMTWHGGTPCYSHLLHRARCWGVYSSTPMTGLGSADVFALGYEGRQWYYVFMWGL